MNGFWENSKNGQFRPKIVLLAPFPWKQEFSQNKGSCQFLALILLKHYRKFQKKSNERVLRKSRKRSFWAQNCPFGPVSMETRIFLKKRASSLSSPCGTLISWKVSEKSNERFLRKSVAYVWTDVRTYGQPSFHRTQPLTRGSNNTEKMILSIYFDYFVCEFLWIFVCLLLTKLMVVTEIIKDIIYSGKVINYWPDEQKATK